VGAIASQRESVALKDRFFPGLENGHLKLSAYQNLGDPEKKKTKKKGETYSYSNLM
jgi:hypothetical protein